MPTLETDQTDVASYLGSLADRLRAEALALEGYQSAYSSDGAQELEAVSGSLRRTGRILEGLGDALCRDCRLRDVIEQVRMERPERIPPDPQGRKPPTSGRAS